MSSASPNEQPRRTISFQVPARYITAVRTSAGTFTSMTLGVFVFTQKKRPKKRGK